MSKTSSKASEALLESSKFDLPLARDCCPMCTQSTQTCSVGKLNISSKKFVIKLIKFCAIVALICIYHQYTAYQIDMVSYKQVVF